MKKSIAVRDQLRKYFFESGLNFLSSVPQNHLQEMILAMAQKGYIGKMTDCSNLGTRHPTTYGYFLSKGNWKHEKVEAIQCQTSFQIMLSAAHSTNQPLYISIDDTVVSKKKPSSRAVHSMEGAGWHYTDQHKLCYRLRRCCAEYGTKVDMTVEVLDSIAETDHPIYILVDSWYTNVAVWNMGLKSFMMRSPKAIDRFLIILSIAWFCFTWVTGTAMPFSMGIRHYRGGWSIS